MVAWLALWTGATSAATPSEQERNKAVILEYRTALETHDLDKVAALTAEQLIQHNPNMRQGRAGVVEFFRQVWSSGGSFSGVRGPNPPVLLLAQDDLVLVMIRRAVPDPQQPAQNYEAFWFDAYRLKDGLVVEHWDADAKRTLP